MVGALADGSAEQELDERQFRLIKELQLQARVQSTAVRGEIVLAIKYEMDESGNCATQYDIKVKEPSPKRPGTILFATPGGNLSTVRESKQQRLPLREVQQHDDELRELGEKGIREA